MYPIGGYVSTELSIYIACKSTSSSATSKGRINEIVAYLEYDPLTLRYELVHASPFAIQANENSIQFVLCKRS